MSVQLSDLFSITPQSLQATHTVCQGLRLFIASDNHHTTTTSAVMPCLKISVYTDLTSEDKVPHWTSSKGTTNINKKHVKLFVPFHAKSGSGLANPWISNVLAENHKHFDCVSDI